MVTIVSRSEWGARAPTSPFYRPPLAQMTGKLYLHHSAGSGTDAAAVRAIQRMHQEDRKWKCVAYSFLADDDPELDQDIFEGRGWGVAGGHTRGQNTVSHALCIIGNFTNRLPHDSTLDQVVDFVVEGHRAGMCPAGFTGGHRDAPGAATSCPGDALWAHIPIINAEITRRLSGAGMQIMGTATAMIDQALDLDWSTNWYTDADLRRILNGYWRICDEEAVDFAVAVAQMRHETGSLAFGGDVRAAQFNFAGIGATGGGEPGESWDTIEAGIRGHVRRLRMYAAGRFDIYNLSVLQRPLSRIHWGKYPTVERAGKTWGTDPEYVEKWMRHIETLRAVTLPVEPTYPAAVEAWDWAERRGLLTVSSVPTDLVTKQDLMVFLRRNEA